MRRSIPLLLVFAVACIAMAQYSAGQPDAAAEQKVALQAQNQDENQKEQERDSSELKNPITKALYDLLDQAEDLEDEDRDEAEKVLFNADEMLTKYKTENRNAIKMINAYNRTSMHDLRRGKIPAPSEKDNERPRQDEPADENEKEQADAKDAKPQAEGDVENDVTKELLSEVENSKDLTDAEKREAIEAIQRADAILSKVKRESRESLKELGDSVSKK